ncbi:Re/Si-specific NAD(P)(+) transhydrogenase subunit alpha [Nostocoides sp. Soil756]|uniref:Re/Si-specific NAD(P)(+) transhydrogenase subunit alpha n=1 Tax=Nostocoides sp. Soil756 TaxID=1736399 RepID=UPI0007014D31|nr:Re/Si-specific NAD(P)(+) transhydrogenase subunit alpha [Tetrasphaera sp. Soil756]KRE60173.1 NAD(P) transhydrogenase subunit alpha [Tetrasphaera sp. Soil756]
MRIGVPRESRPGETRVAATPRTVEQLVALGYVVFVEHGAGRLASFDDTAYRAAGADVIDDAVWNADVILKINAPSDDELERLRPGQLVASLMSPALEPELVQKLADRGVTALAMDAVPRISRAQSLDVLSSMANIGGYRAVIEAAHEFGSFFTGQVTAAGKVPPAKVLVVGAGVAGLAAIGTANSLGAVVRAFDARPEVAEQVESMGAQFLRIDVDDSGPSADGYAKETSADFDAKAAALYAEQAADVDIVITTALIPGRPAPRLFTEEMVASMKPGSVVVDMAAANGGNVAGTVAGQKVVTDHGVTILGYTDLPGRLPTQASQLFGTNLVNLMKLLTPGQDGELVLDLDDVVQRGMTVVREGEVLWPPPPVQVSAAAPAPGTAVATLDRVAPEPKTPMSASTRLALAGAAVALFLLVSVFAPAPFLGHFMVFMLAVVIGFYVIGNVHHALHTPLMSVTNAISGIIVVGALLQVGRGHAAVTVLAFVGILVASINVFGGFRVTARMLGMFRREEATR